MDRRTEYEVIGGHKHAVPERYFDTDDVVQALAAYEDTGLEPQEITPRLRELAQADEEGRIVVLPCKVGDICYEIDPGHPGAIKHTVTGTTIYNRQADGNRYMTDFVNVIIIDTWAVAEDGCEWADQYTVAEWADAPKTRPEAEAALTLKEMADEIEEAT